MSTSILFSCKYALTTEEMGFIHAQRTDEILFVKVENDGFDLGAQRRKIDKNDLPKALQEIREFRKKVLGGEKSQTLSTKS